jgi:protein translocase SEC61 complex gamma subunit
MVFWKKKKQNETKEHKAEDHKVEAVPGAAAQAKEPNVQEMHEAQEKAAQHVAKEKVSPQDKTKFSLFKPKPSGQPKIKFIAEAKRVLLVAKKPSSEEYKASFKITGLGILIIGAIGMAIFLLFRGLLGF